MAGDWIKMRCDLADDPAVITMADTLGLDVDVIVGKLHRIWSWASKQSRDGHVSVTVLYLDRMISVKGLSDAMRAVAWLEADDKGNIVFPKWEFHNSQSAKARALAMSRKRHSRVTQESRAHRDQRREEKSITPIVPKGTNFARGGKTREERAQEQSIANFKRDQARAEKAAAERRAEIERQAAELAK